MPSEKPNWRFRGQHPFVALIGSVRWRTILARANRLTSGLTLGSEGATRWNAGAFPSPFRKGNSFFTSMKDPGPDAVRQSKLGGSRRRRRKSVYANTYIRENTKVE